MKLAEKVSALRKRSPQRSALSSSASSTASCDVRPGVKSPSSFVPRAPAAFPGKMRLNQDKMEKLLDILFRITMEAVQATTVESDMLLFQTSFTSIKEIVWDHSERSMRFVLDNGSSSATFLFTSLSEVEGQLASFLENPTLTKVPEHVYLGVYIGKNLPSPIQQRKASYFNEPPQAQLPNAKRRELLVQDRPPKSFVLRETLGLEYVHFGFMTFSCSSQGDSRFLKLDLHYISVFPSRECHDRSACLFSYPYEQVDNCESTGTRLEFHFHRSDTKQPVYLAFLTTEAQVIRDAVYYLKKGEFVNCLNSWSRQDPNAPHTSSPRQNSLLHFQDLDQVHRQLHSLCKVIGCRNMCDACAKTTSGLSNVPTSPTSHANPVVGFCHAHYGHVVPLTKMTTKLALFSREKTSIRAGYQFNAKHYIRFVTFHGQLLKRGGKYQLTTKWSPKIVALLETPVGALLCFYQKLAHCPGSTECPRERRVIDMSSVIFIRPESTAPNAPPFAFDIVTLYRSWSLAASDAEQYDLWLTVLAQAVEKHATMSPDRSLRFPVRILVDPCHRLPRQDTNIHLEVSAHGVLVTSGVCGENELYNWYFTEIQKWSPDLQNNVRCCVLNCLVKVDKEMSFQNFVFQTEEPDAVCSAIEFHVGKCMSKAQVLSQLYLIMHPTEASEQPSRRSAKKTPSTNRVDPPDVKFVPIELPEPSLLPLDPPLVHQSLSQDDAVTSQVPSSIPMVEEQDGGVDSPAPPAAPAAAQSSIQAHDVLESFPVESPVTKPTDDVFVDHDQFRQSDQSADASSSTASTPLSMAIIVFSTSESNAKLWQKVIDLPLAEFESEPALVQVSAEAKKISSSSSNGETNVESLAPTTAFQSMAPDPSTPKPRQSSSSLVESVLDGLIGQAAQRSRCCQQEQRQLQSPPFHSSPVVAAVEGEDVPTDIPSAMPLPVIPPPAPQRVDSYSSGYDGCNESHVSRPHVQSTVGEETQSAPATTSKTQDEFERFCQSLYEQKPSHLLLTSAEHVAAANAPKVPRNFCFQPSVATQDRSKRSQKAHKMRSKSLMGSITTINAPVSPPVVKSALTSTTSNVAMIQYNPAAIPLVGDKGRYRGDAAITRGKKRAGSVRAGPSNSQFEW